MKAKGMGEMDVFPFLEKPSSKAIADAIANLQELGALDEDAHLTHCKNWQAFPPIRA